LCRYGAVCLNLPRRKSNSPWGSSYKEGLPSTAVNDTIEVDQLLIPSVNTGNIDVQTGQWQGITLSDQNFTIDATHESVANGAVVLSPQATPDYIDMTGYSTVIFALRPSNAGAYAVAAVMGPANHPFANLAPVNAAAPLKGAFRRSDMDNLLFDASESMTANVWNIFPIINQLQTQKLLQFSITNNSGGVSNIDFAYLRSL